MSSEPVEIAYEPYRKIVIHEVVEFKLADLVTQLVAGASAAGGTTIPSIQWCGGVVFTIVPFNPNSEEVISEQLKGIVHYASVVFAVKERFESEVRTRAGTIRLLDASAASNFVRLAAELRKMAKYSE